MLIMSAALAATSGVVMTTVAVAAAVIASAAVGAAIYAGMNIVQQGILIAADIQDGFDWSQVGKQAISGAESGAFAAATAGAGMLSGVAQTLAKVAIQATRIYVNRSSYTDKHGHINNWSGMTLQMLSVFGNGSEAANQAGKAADNANKAMAAVNWINQNANYISPWLNLAETSIHHNGQLTDADWVNAIGQTFNAVVGDNVQGTRYTDVIKRSALETVGAVALSSIDKEAAYSYFENSVANEIGKYAGGKIKQVLKTDTWGQDAMERAKRLRTAAQMINQVKKTYHITEAEEKVLLDAAKDGEFDTAYVLVNGLSSGKEKAYAKFDHETGQVSVDADLAERAKMDPNAAAELYGFAMEERGHQLMAKLENLRGIRDLKLDEGALIGRGMLEDAAKSAWIGSFSYSLDFGNGAQTYSFGKANALDIRDQYFGVERIFADYQTNGVEYAGMSEFANPIQDAIFAMRALGNDNFGALSPDQKRTLTNLYDQGVKPFDNDVDLRWNLSTEEMGTLGDLASQADEVYSSLMNVNTNASGQLSGAAARQILNAVANGESLKIGSSNQIDANNQLRDFLRTFGVESKPWTVKSISRSRMAGTQYSAESLRDVAAMLSSAIDTGVSDQYLQDKGLDRIFQYAKGDDAMKSYQAIVDSIGYLADGSEYNRLETQMRGGARILDTTIASTTSESRAVAYLYAQKSDFRKAGDIGLQLAVENFRDGNYFTSAVTGVGGVASSLTVGTMDAVLSGFEKMNYAEAPRSIRDSGVQDLAIEAAMALPIGKGIKVLNELASLKRLGETGEVIADTRGQRWFDVDNEAALTVKELEGRVPNKNTIGIPVTHSPNRVSPVLDFDAHGNEILYRTMSPADFAKMQRTGQVPATGETFVSPLEAYSAGYDGTLVRITVKKGTMDQLQTIGVSGNPGTSKLFPDLPTETSGWTANNAMFKLEGSKGAKNAHIRAMNEGYGVVNTGLGKGEALKIFNSNILKYEPLN
ncbi:hypothetical protein [Gynuella sunshinyii]|uniref:Uncharacterized protein n=1 Tax=Gynuella sunshinyii YC6258 TaxID=1445510 RepID=A0A0C5VIU6_9GAMM|nr:hypothetical protein [Gynuella sunshinyii]AJQ94186.1 hypothetical Protein YC6258_02148 [Gynuella sunshinyii YC6258]